MPAQTVRNVILRRGVGAADDLELGAMVVREHAAEGVALRLPAEVGADVAHAQLTIRIRLVRMVGAGGAIELRRPCAALGLQARRRRPGIEIERENQTAVDVSIVRLERERTPIARDR